MSIDGSNQFILTVDRKRVVRIHPEYAVAMRMGEIGGDPARQLPSIFGRRGPWERPLSKMEHSKTVEDLSCRSSTPWAEGLANCYYCYYPGRLAACTPPSPVLVRRSGRRIRGRMRKIRRRRMIKRSRRRRRRRTRRRGRGRRK